eukprot:COSAG02_NODE_64470_length_260_cov_0.950311_1_plen_69_part_01
MERLQALPHFSSEAHSSACNCLLSSLSCLHPAFVSAGIFLTSRAVRSDGVRAGAADNRISRGGQRRFCP